MSAWLRVRSQKMYHSAVFPLNQTDVLSISNNTSTDDDEVLPSFQPLHRTSTKSLILSPFTLTKAFSPSTTVALLHPGGGDGPASPLLYPAISNSLGTQSGMDFTTLLPVEIMVKVFLYLDPQDLCRYGHIRGRYMRNMAFVAENNF